MSARTGLAAEVPTLDLCREMAAIPALAEAFKESTFLWIPSTLTAPVIHARHGWSEVVGDDALAKFPPAPTVREMLAWLEKFARIGMGYNQDAERWEVSVSEDDDGQMLPVMFTGNLTDPDALARACIEAAS